MSHWFHRNPIKAANTVDFEKRSYPTSTESRQICKYYENSNNLFKLINCESNFFQVSLKKAEQLYWSTLQIRQNRPKTCRVSWKHICLYSKVLSLMLASRLKIVNYVTRSISNGLNHWAINLFSRFFFKSFLLDARFSALTQFYFTLEKNKIVLLSF